MNPLKQYKLDNNLTLPKLSEMIGLSLPALSVIMRHKEVEEFGKMSLSAVHKIKSATGVDLLDYYNKLRMPN